MVTVYQKRQQDSASDPVIVHKMHACMCVDRQYKNMVTFLIKQVKVCYVRLSLSSPLAHSPPFSL